MLSALRKLLENWIARVLFGLLIAIFVFWGISNVLTLVGNNTAVAHVGGRPVDIAAVQAAYQTALNTAEQTNPTPAPAMRQQLAETALSNVLRQQTLQLEADRLGVVAPNAAVRKLVYAIPAFQTNGTFSQSLFNQVLQANNRSPDSFLADVKNTLIERQLIFPVIAGAGAPDELANQIFSYLAEERFAETVNVTYASQPVPALPAPAVLQRYWRNHPALFTTPEYRTIKLVLLSPSLLAPQELVSEQDLNAAYARATEGQQSVQLRSVQVITAPNAAAAAALRDAWRKGATWSQIQAQVKQSDATAVELDNAAASQFPSSVLSAAVFAAAPNTVTGPVQGPFGLFVFKVTQVTNSAPPQVELRSQIRQQLQLQKAQQAVAADVNNLQDALAGQTPLDKLPGNLGLTALAGTLDASGNTPEGPAAPIPGGAALKAAVVKAAFAAQPGQPAQLINGPDGSYFALTVDQVTPPHLADFAQVQDKVAAAWRQDQIHREAEVQAASLLAAVNHGQNFDAAADAAGEAVTMTPPVTRNAPPSGMVSQMVQILFSLSPGQATMLQTDSGFTVTVLDKVIQPTPAQDPQDYGQVRTALARELQDDLASSFVVALQNRDHVSVDQKLFAQIYQ